MRETAKNKIISNLNLKIMLDQLHRMREELEKELIKDAFQRGLLWGIVIALAFVIILLFLSHLGIFDSFIMETMVKNQ